MQLWSVTHSRPDHALEAAQRAEAAGWAGLCVVDSQNLAPDCYVALTLAATVTGRLGLGTGVTNSVTRHPAATASAAMAVQQVSGGRMVLGIGRGDSALAHLGRAPARLAGFSRYVAVLQRYLRGERVEFSDLPMDDAIAAPVAALELADHPQSSRIRWFDPALPKVPLEVAATGPRVIDLAGREADRVLLTLGAVPERLRWGIDLARRARRDSGGDPDSLALGAYVNLVCHPDRAIARDLVRGGLTTFARFSVMHGTVSGPADEETRGVLARLHDGYDMRAHTRGDSVQATLMDDAFVDAFAIAGPPDHCLARLAELEALGIDKVIVSGPTAGTDRDAARKAMALLDEAVVPVLRS
ncbi:MAG: LLM class flavin-dependent oxidoreductase [Pseudomonadales bacterium]